MFDPSRLFDALRGAIAGEKAAESGVDDIIGALSERGLDLSGLADATPEEIRRMLAESGFDPTALEGVDVARLAEGLDAENPLRAIAAHLEDGSEQP